MTANDSTVVVVTPDCPCYPPSLRDFLGNRAPSIASRGNLKVLQTRTLALFGSVRCPGNLIVQTYDLARALRDLHLTMIGGFHTPMEKECLRLLLRGKSPIIVCPARSIDRYRIPADWRLPLDDGRLLLLSPFAAAQRRPTTDLAAARNEFVAALADEILVAFATPGGKTESLSLQALAAKKPVYTLPSPETQTLIAAGAISVNIHDLPWARSPGTQPADILAKT